MSLNNVFVYIWHAFSLNCVFFLWTNSIGWWILHLSFNVIVYIKRLKSDVKNTPLSCVVTVTSFSIVSLKMLWLRHLVSYGCAFYKVFGNCSSNSCNNLWWKSQHTTISKREERSKRPMLCFCLLDTHLQPKHKRIVHHVR